MSDEPSFLRATAQRAGSLVLYAPRRAVDAVLPSQGRVRRWVPSVLLPQSIARGGPTVGGSVGGGASTPATTPRPSTSSGTTTPSPLLLPSPLTYLTSAYLFTSLTLAFLLHRIHRLVPPRTRTSIHSQTANGTGGLARVFSPAVQIGCRAPGVLLMLRAAAGLWAAMYGAGAGAGAEGALEWLREGGGGGGFLGVVGRGVARALVWSTAWAGKGAFASFLQSQSEAGGDDWKVDHPSLLWSVFLAVAASLVCETFTRALSDDLPSVHHFNLLSFSFLLHVHSGPPLSSASSKSAAASSSSSSRDLYLYLLLTLLELTTLQLSYCLPFLPSFPFRRSSHPRPRPARRSTSTPRPHRLAITAVFSLLSQYFAVRSWARLFSGSGAGEDGGAASGDAVVSIWLNKAPEVAFEIVVGVSLGLKALAAVIRGEELSRENIVGHPALAPSREEDYGVALIKYTTHLLSTTRLSGLALELSPLEVLPLTLSTPLTSLGLLDLPLTEEEVEKMRREEERMVGEHGAGGGTGVVLRANGEVWFDEPVPLEELEGLRRRGGFPSSSSGGSGEGGPHGVGCTCSYDHPHPPPLDGFAHEIRRVTIEDPHNPLPSGGSGGPGDAFLFDPGAHPHAPGGASMVHLEGQRKGALWRFVKLVGRIGVYLAWRGVRGVKEAVGRVWGTVWRGEVDVRGWRAEGRERRGRSRSPEVREMEEGEEEEDDGGEYVPGAAEEEEEEGEDGWSSSDEGPEGEEEETKERNSDEDELALLSPPPPRSPLRQRRLRSPFSPSLDDSDPQSSAFALYTDLSHPPSSPHHQQQQQQRPSLPHRTTSTDLVLHSSSGATLSPEDLAPYLLAHHLRPAEAGPLTRRRYNALLPSASSSSSAGYPHSHDCSSSDAAAEAATTSALLDRRRAVLSSFASSSSSRGGGGTEGVKEAMERKREEWREGRSRFCVVCTVEERSVVLWPCRCLCLCEPCRAALADRTTSTGGGAGSSTAAGFGGENGTGGAICPTCRTPVQAFSRIYIP